MTILKQLERTILAAEDNEIFVIYKNRKYETTSGKFHCVSDPDKVDLYPHLREEVMENLDSAREELKKMKNPSTTTASPLGSSLEELLIKTIASASVDKIVEEVKPELSEYIMKTFGILPKRIEVSTPQR